MRSPFDCLELQSPFVPRRVSGYSVSIGSGPFETGALLTATVSGLSGGETVTYQWTDDGGNITGATSSTYTAAIGTDGIADASAIGVTITVDGGDPITSGTREIRYAAATGGADLDLSFPEDSAISSTDLVQNWTATNLTLTYVSVSPALPAGLSINSSGTMTGTPTTVTADATYTLTMQDQYGRETSDTFTLEITEADTTAPVVNSSSYTDATQSVSTNITEASGSATVYWALVANPSTPTGAQVKAGSGGGILEAGSFAVTDGTNNDTISVTDETGDEIHIYVEDASGNNTGNPSALNNTIITGITVDSTAPTITSYSPADNATDVAVDATLSIVFSESMDTSASTTVTLKNVGGATIETFDSLTDGTWSTTTNANDTWTVTPASNFTNEASLAVQYSGFKDVYGNSAAAVANDTTWNFDVVAAGATNLLATQNLEFTDSGVWVNQDANSTVNTGTGVASFLSTSVSNATRVNMNKPGDGGTVYLATVSENTSYTVTFDINTVTTGGDYRINFDYYTAAESSISISLGSNVTASVGQASRTITTPATCERLAITVQCRTTGLEMDFDNVSLEAV